jgi:hypothetical protein
VLGNIEFSLQWFEQFGQYFDQQTLDLGHVLAARLFDFEFELLKYVLRRGNARVSHNKAASSSV